MRRIFGRRREDAARHKSLRQRSPSLQQLEDRRMMAVALADDEFRVNVSITRGQAVASEAPALGIAPSGESFVVFAGRGPGDDAGIFARRFDSSGVALGRDFLVNATTRGVQTQPSIDVAADGSFVAVWEGRGVGDQSGVFARRFSAAGQPLTSELLVNTTTAGDQRGASVDHQADGSFVVTWSGNGTGDFDGVFYRRFNSTGGALSGELRANTTTTLEQSYSSVAVAPDGGFVIVWSSRHQDGSDWGVFGQRFAADGRSIGSEFRINATSAGSQVRPSVAVDGAGNVVVAWNSRGSSNDSWDVMGRLFNRDGQSQGDEFVVHADTTGIQKDARVATAADGSFLVTWTNGVPDGSGWEVLGRSFAPTGEPAGDAFQINQQTAGIQSGHQQLASAAISENGTGRSVWMGLGETDRSGIFTASLTATSLSAVQLTPIEDRAIDELTQLSIPVQGSAGPGESLTFAFERAPSGATIHPTTGAITWNTTESDGPGVFPFTVVASVVGSPSRLAKETFIVTVREVNTAPNLAAIANQIVVEQTELSFTASATDSDLPAQTLIYRLDPGAPTGSTIDPITGQFRWTPTEEQGPGDYPVTVRVNDLGSPDLSAPRSFTITVQEANRPPVLTKIQDLTIAEQSQLVVALSAIDPDVPANTLTYRLDEGSPTNATINGATGVITWQPNAEQIGQPHTFFVSVVDNGTPALSDSDSFDVFVIRNSAPPVLAPIEDQAINEGLTFTFTPVATDENGPSDTLTFSLDDKPPTAEIDPQTGEITWLTTEADGFGQFVFTVRATDSGGLFDTQAFVLTVNEVNAPPVLAAIDNRAIPEQTTLELTGLATDPDLPANPLTYSLVGESPTNATIDGTTGLITWIPSEEQGPGNYEFTVRVSDNQTPPLTDDKTFVVTVGEVNRPPVLSPIPDQTIDHGTELTIVLTATDPDLPPNTLTYTIVEGPEGATIEGNVFRWAPLGPQPAEPQPVRIRVTDNGTPALFDEQEFTITVINCLFDEQLTGWSVHEDGGTLAGRGGVSSEDCQAILIEGDSFVVTVERAFVVPEGATTLTFSYADLFFDTTATDFVKDAFEVALVDSEGNPLVSTYAVGRDAFFNITEGLEPALGDSAMLVGATVTLALAGIPAGTQARLIFRLANNDDDTATTVRITEVELPTLDTAAVVTDSKFFVVDAFAQTIFGYGASGAETGTFVPSQQAHAPRGIAANPTGTTVWIIDAATNLVGVYGADGTRVGAWQPLDITQPEGISVFGSDVWIVDAASDQVQQYSGAASRLFGTSTPAAGFALDAANTSPSDLVTDGTTIWVTDDVADLVFVYSTAGVLLGSWALDPANADASGITLDPTGASTDLWTVDRADAVVYRYALAQARISGSQAAADSFVLAVGNAQPEGIADPPTQTPLGDSLLDSNFHAHFTTGEDFQLGTLFNSNTTDTPDALQLNAAGATELFNFIWVSNAGEGTISKFDTVSGDELGRYRTGPNSLSAVLSPSRTAVTSAGDVWVANRGINNSNGSYAGIQTSIVKILNQNFVDRNADGIAQSSQDTNGNKRIVDAGELLPWDANLDGIPDDERIALSILVGRSRTNHSQVLTNGIPRSITVDKNDNVWVGLWELRQYEVYNGANGDLIDVIPVDIAIPGSPAPTGRPYGAVVDSNGLLWGVGYGANYFDVIDTNTRTYLGRVSLGGDAYGITLGSDGVIWTAAYNSKQLIGYRPSAANPLLGDIYRHNLPGLGRGVAVASDNSTIFVAINQPSIVSRFRLDPANYNSLLSRLDTPNLGGTPTAAAIDAEGFVWTTVTGTNKAWKINSDSMTAADGWPKDTGAIPYNYSDMTGQVRLSVTERSGTWTEIFDGESADFPWAGVDLLADTPLGTSVDVRVRSSNNRFSLAGLPWQDIVAGTPFVGIRGQFLEVEFLLRSTERDSNPSVQEISVVGVAPPQIALLTPDADTSLPLGAAVISGLALADRPLVGDRHYRNAITHVMVNGRPVDVLDASGNFFARVDIKPGENFYEFTAFDSLGQSATTSVTILGTSRNPAQIDFSQFADISASFKGVYGRTSFHARDNLLYVDLATQNNGTFVADVPLLVGIKNISDPSVRVLGADGVLPDGTPYYDFTSFVSGQRLSPGETSDSPTIAFQTPDRRRFDYELVFYGKLNQAPAFTSLPGVEAIVGKAYAYTATASDPDGDPVTIALLAGPVGAQIIGGVLTWTPEDGDQGNHDVVLEVTDGRGGVARQSYVLTAQDPQPNRPPVFTTLPVTEAVVSPRIEEMPIPLAASSTTTTSVAYLRPISSDGPANWVFNADGSVLQTRNSDPAILLFDNLEVANKSVAGTLRVNDTTDDDWIGFVFGYQDRDRFYVFDWAKGGGNNFAQLRIRVANGSRAIVESDFGRDDSDAMKTLARLSVGWSPSRSYSFSLDFQPGRFVVTIKDGAATVFSETIVDSTFLGGRFGFYNYSQEQVLYSGFASESIAPITYRYDANAIDPDFDAVQYALIDGPAGMTVNPTTGEVLWAPTAADLNSAPRPVDPTLPIVPGFDLSVYASVTDPMRMVVDELGRFFVGRDNFFSGGANADAVKVHRIGNLGNNVVEIGSAAIIDPDAIAVDVKGTVTGVPGAILVGGIRGTNQGGITAILPNGSLQEFISPTNSFLDVSKMQIDDSGRLLFVDTDSSPATLFVVTDGTVTPLISLPMDFEFTVLSDGRIAISPTDGTIRLYDSLGQLIDSSFVSGLPGSAILAAGPGGPWGDGLYALVPTNGELSKIDSAGSRSVLATGFVNTGDIAFGPDGALYLSQREQDRILRIAPNRETLGLHHGEHRVVLAASDGRGGVATQEYTICVEPEPGNHAPTIVSQPIVQIPAHRHESDRTVSDGEFAEGTWTYETYFRGANTSTAEVIQTGGLPDRNLFISQSTGGGGTLNYQVAIFNEIYNPALTGAIESIDFQIDRRTPYAQYGGSTGLRLIIEQDGRLFGVRSYPIWSPAGANVSWKNETILNLKASDFNEFLGLDGGLWHDDTWAGNSPDFGPDAGEIRFGFVTEIGAALGSQRIDTAVDNFRVGINVASEPQIYTYDVDALDPDGDTVTYSLVNGPSGMVIDQFTGQISWQVPPTSTVVFSSSFNSVRPTEISGAGEIESVQGFAGLGALDGGFAGSFLRNVTGGVSPSTRTILTLTGLPDHESIDLSFLLAIIDSWDGASSSYPAPDYFNVVVDGHTVFREAFDNIQLGQNQIYVPADGGQLGDPTRDARGFTSHFDSAYDMSVEPALRRIPHTADSLTIEFFADGGGWQGGDDESWAIDNLSVIANGPTSFPVTVRVEDGRGGVDEQTFTITVGRGTGEIRGSVVEAGQFVEQVVASSSFDTGLDGWVSVQNQAEISWQPSGGNPDGFLQYVQLPLNGPAMVEAPPQFRGDWRSYDGIGVLSFHQKVIDPGPNVTNLQNRSVVLSGAGGSATWIGSMPPAVASDWETFAIPIRESDWTVTAGTWQGLLENVSSIRIKVELFGNSSGSDVSGLDDVRLLTIQAVGIDSWQIYLDLNNNARLDIGEPSTTTDANGEYSFTGLVDGTYVVRQVPQRGWEQTSPSGLSHVVTVVGGQIFTGIDFGNVQLAADALNRPPLANAIESNTATVGELFRYDPRAFDPDGDPITFDLVSKPTGMVVDPKTGSVFWIPRSDQVGEQRAVLRIQDDRGGITLQTIDLEVSLPNSQPIVTSTPPGPATVGLPYEYQIRVQDAENDVVEFFLDEPIAGMSLDKDTGLLTWTSEAADVPMKLVRVRLDAQTGVDALYEFTIQVVASSANRTPSILNVPGSVGRAGQSYTHIIEALDPDGDPLVYSLVAPLLPSMTLGVDEAGQPVSAKGLLRWIPPAEMIGTRQTFAIKVEDGRGASDVKTFTVDVVAAGVNSAPQIVSTPTSAGTTAGRTFEYQLAARDAEGDPLLWQLLAAPSGVSLQPFTGLLLWTPGGDDVRTHEFLVRVTDSYGGVDEQRFVLDVACANQPPAIISRPPTQAVKDTLYVYAVRADDREGDRVTFKMLTKPDNMTIDAQGVIRWTPSPAQAGNTHNVVIEARDAAGGVARQVFSISVLATPPNKPPVITSLAPNIAPAGGVYQYTARAFDPEGDAVAFSIENALADMEITPTGVLTWNVPEDALGEQPGVTVIATDSAGGKARQTFKIDVQANAPPVLTPIADQETRAGSTFRLDVRAVDTPGDRLTYGIAGPAGMTVDQFGRITWSVPHDAASATPVPVMVTVTDSVGASATDEFTILVQADNSGPIVTLRMGTGGLAYNDPVRLNPGAVANFRVVATDDTGIASTSLELVNSSGQRTPVALNGEGRADSIMPTPGVYSVVARAVDVSGNTTEVTRQLFVLNPADTNPPSITIISPLQDARVTNLIDVTGTIDDPEDQLLRWDVYVIRSDLVPPGNLDFSNPHFKKIGSGTTEVTNARLATFDPTMLTNDGYTIWVVAYDATGQGWAEPVNVQIEGNTKLGQFRLEFVDLQIPIAGIPITVSRTYDTRQAAIKGDFGFGWNLGLRDGQIRETAAFGVGGALVGDNTFIPDRTKVYLTGPNGERLGFTYKEQLTGGSWFGGHFKPYFVADAGNNYTLSIDETTVLRGGPGGALAAGINPDNYTLTAPDGLKYRYNQFTGLQSITDLNGTVLTFKSDGIYSGATQIVTFHRDVQNRITKISYPFEQEDGTETIEEIIYQYDAAGDLRVFRNQENLESNYAYLATPAHYMHELIDPNGNRAVKMEYDENGRIKSVTDANGNPVAYEYDLENNTETIHDANGNRTRLTYDDEGNVTREVLLDDDGNTIRETLYEYGDTANPTKETKVTQVVSDGLGGTREIVTNYKYDARGNTTEVSDAIGTRTFKYNAKNVVTEVKDELGRVSVFQYDAANNLRQVINAVGSASSIVYDAQGRPTSYTDFRGATTTFVYQGSNSQPSEIQNAGDGSVKKFQYNAFGQVTRSEDEAGVVTHSDYDDLGRLIRERRGNDAPVAYEYTGQLQTRRIVRRSVVDSGLADLITRFAYYPDQKLKYEVDPEGHVTGYRYDKNGNRTMLGRWVTESDFLLEDTSVAADPHLTFAHATFQQKFYYDAANHLDFEVDDYALSLPAASDFDRIKLDYEYDEVGNRTKIIDRNGRVRTFEYDDRGRVLFERWYTDAADTTADREMTYQYDAVGNLLFASDPDSTYTYTYDTLGRLRTVDNAGTPNMPHVVLTYSYDANGNRIGVADNFGVSVVSTYDPRNRLDTRAWVNTTAQQIIDEILVDFDYCNCGQISQISRYTGSSVDPLNLVGRSTYGDHDAAGRVQHIEHMVRRNGVDVVLADYQYRFDDTGLVKSLAYSNENSQHNFEVDYLYDDLGQLLGADYSDETTAKGVYVDEFYEYDDRGNRVDSYLHPRAAQTDGTSYETGASNRLLSDGTYAYEYDNEGNTRFKRKIGAETTEFTEYRWDHRNRLVEVEIHEPGKVTLVKYTYDLTGRRLGIEVLEGVNEPTVITSTTRMVYDGEHVWADFDAANVVTEQYLYGDRIDQIIAEFRSDSEPVHAIAWHLSDVLGTTRDLSSSAGAVIDQIGYGSFGVLVTFEPQSRYSFTGREFNYEIGLYGFRTRYYNPAIGGFASEDILRFEADDFNLFRYVRNTPLTLIDPFGTVSMSEAVIIDAHAAGATAGANAAALSQLSARVGTKFAEAAIADSLGLIASAQPGNFVYTAAFTFVRSALTSFIRNLPTVAAKEASVANLRLFITQATNSEIAKALLAGLL